MEGQQTSSPGSRFPLDMCHSFCLCVSAAVFLPRSLCLSEYVSLPQHSLSYPAFWFSFCLSVSLGPSGSVSSFLLESLACTLSFFIILSLFLLSSLLCLTIFAGDWKQTCSSLFLSLSSPPLPLSFPSLVFFLSFLSLFSPSLPPSLSSFPPFLSLITFGVY